MKYIKIKKSILQSASNDYIHIIKDNKSYYCTFSTYKEPQLGSQIFKDNILSLKEAEKLAIKLKKNNMEILRFIKKGEHPNVKWIEVDKKWKRK